MRQALREWMEGVVESPYHLAVRQNGRVRMLDLRSVSRVGAERDYVRFHVGRQSVLVRMTMARAERELAPRRFVRIHRSAMVNLDFIAEMRPVRGGDCRVLLREGTVLTLSRSFRKRAVAERAPE
jgi:two-component system LytT family response regulator